MRHATLFAILLAAPAAHADVDFHWAFDQKTLVDVGKPHPVHVVEAGELALPDGKLAAFDPLAFVDGEPFARTVPPGNYKVQLLELTDEHRHALARVVIAKGTPVTWVLAVRGDEDERSLMPGALFGYGVDAGTGCFVAAGYVAQVATQSQALLAVFKAQLDAVARVPAQGPASLIAFASGYGDGIYPSWWGLDAKGLPLELVTDFKVGDFPRPTVKDDPSFRKQYARTVLAKLVRATDARARSTSYADVDGAYRAVPDLASLGADELGPIMPDFTKELAKRDHDAIRADPMIALARMFAEQEALQPALATWLSRAPTAAAVSFAGMLEVPRMTPGFAKAVAHVLVATQAQPMLELRIGRLRELENQRAAFLPWVTKLAKQTDAAGTAAREVLAAWQKRPEKH